MPPADIFTPYLFTFGATAAGVPADTRVRELRDWTTLEYVEVLNRPPSFQGSLPYWHDEAAQVDAPAYRHLYIDVGGLLRCGGPIWVTDLDPDQGAQLRFQGEGFLSAGATGPSGARRTFQSRAGMTYPDVVNVAPGEIKFTNIDQFRIVTDILAHAASWAGAGNQFAFDTVNLYGPSGGGLSGQTRSRSYFTYESKSLYDAIQELSQQQFGFDFAEVVRWDQTTTPWTPKRDLNLYYPRRGLAASAVTLEHGENCSLLTRTRNGRAVQNPHTEFGAGIGDAGLFSFQIDATYIFPAGPYPYIEGQHRAGDEAIQGNLNRLSRATLAAFRSAPQTLTLVMQPEADTKLGDVNVGDTCRVIGAFPGSIDIDEWMRVVGQRVVANAQTGLERWELSLATNDATLGNL